MRQRLASMSAGAAALEDQHRIRTDTDVWFEIASAQAAPERMRR
jgi:hypothetical protein